MAAIMRLAAEHGCRVLITGDHEQLAAVEGGGGMLMLTRRMGYVQLAEPVRFTHEWERSVSLRLRAGDMSVLAQYDEQGRLRGGNPEDAIEVACRAWLADHLSGKNALLLARAGEQARELSRRVREDLVRYGVVGRGAGARLRHGAVAARGDLIVARKNNRKIIVGQPMRWLTNGDVLRVESVTRLAVVVRRQLRHHRDGRPVWSPKFEIPLAYVRAQRDLAYATTVHAVQGKTVDTSHVLVDGLGDRQGLYVAMSRGREANYAYCVTGFPRLADVREGSRPAAELARARKLSREHAGLTAEPEDGEQDEQAPECDPVSVLAEVLQRDGSILSATETLRRELSNADHLGVLGSIWYDLARRAQATRFEQSLRDILPAADADAALDDPACTWLWRSLREAEAAGLDADQLLRSAVAARPLTGARHVARVIDSRVRRALTHTVPAVPATWSQRVPDMADPELNRYMTELAAAMDDRVRRIGEHIAETRPPWAVHALGDVPDDPVAQLAWEERVSKLGAYRELYGYDAQDSAIGPEPGKTSPEARADWHAAFAALGRIDGIDLRSCTDAQLQLRRAMYERETSWAPSHVGEELRLARLQARTAWENAVRADHEARVATESAVMRRHQALAGIWHAMEAKATRIADMLAETQETRQQWEALTEPTRRVAIAADLELRRRHPEMVTEPLKSAEPAGIRAPDLVPAELGREAWVQETLDGAIHLTQPAQRAAGTPVGAPLQTPAQRETHGKQALGLTPTIVHDPVPEQVHRICENARLIQDQIDNLRATPEPGEGDDAINIGPAWPDPTIRDRAPILQPPKPDISPATAILARVQQRQASLAEHS